MFLINLKRLQIGKPKELKQLNSFLSCRIFQISLELRSEKITQKGKTIPRTRLV
jgi:hypothetical protein